MKQLTYACCLIAACICPAVAGSKAVISGSKSAPDPAPAPPAYNPSNWFIGGGVEYLFDTEEDYWNGHIGYNFDAANSIFLEVGWLDADETRDYTLNSTAAPFLSDLDIEIIPITLNYKYEWDLSDNISWYLGAGLGAAYGDFEVDNNGFAPDLSDSDWSFMCQAFTGLVYEVNPSFELYLGGRYMWIDEFDVLEDEFDDFSLGGGFRFNF